jgi:hypothetical protein
VADRALFGLWAFFLVTRWAGGGEMGLLGGLSGWEVGMMKVMAERGPVGAFRWREGLCD